MTKCKFNPSETNLLASVCVDRSLIFYDLRGKRHGRTLILRRSCVLEVEAYRKLEIELNGPTLMRPTQCIADHDVDLWPVEGSVSRIELPLQTQTVQRFGQPLLGLIPDLNVSQELFRPGGQFEFVSKAKGVVNVLQKVQSTLHLLFDLQTHNDAFEKGPRDNYNFVETEQKIKAALKRM